MGEVRFATEGGSSFLTLRCFSGVTVAFNWLMGVLFRFYALRKRMTFPNFPWDGQNFALVEAQTVLARWWRDEFFSLGQNAILKNGAPLTFLF